MKKIITVVGLLSISTIAYAADKPADGIGCSPVLRSDLFARCTTELEGDLETELEIYANRQQISECPGTELEAPITMAVQEKGLDRNPLYHFSGIKVIRTKDKPEELKLLGEIVAFGKSEMKYDLTSQNQQVVLIGTKTKGRVFNCKIKLPKLDQK